MCTFWAPENKIIAMFIVFYFFIFVSFPSMIINYVLYQNAVFKFYDITCVLKKIMPICESYFLFSFFFSFLFFFCKSIADIKEYLTFYIMTGRIHVLVSKTSAKYILKL